VREVVITAMGCVSPIGNSIAEFERALFAGRSGVKAIRGTRVGQSFPVPYAAFIEREGLKTLVDEKQFAFVGLVAAHATAQAVHELRGQKVDAVLYGTADGMGYEAIRETFQHFPEVNVGSVRGERPLQAITEVLKQYQIEFDDSQLISINGACSSGNQALGMAMQRIRSGEWERAIVGGVDARCSGPNLMNFHMLGALCDEDIEPSQASRPFAKDRSGFIRGEGAATLVLETRAAAEARGAKILARLCGYANTTDANRLTDGRDDALCVKKAITWAIEDAGVKKEDIDAISAHGTSTPLNDRLETKAIKEVFGERAYQIPVTSLKSQIGHSTVAAGALEAVSCVLMLQEQRLAPTINYNVPDPDCDLDYVPNQARAAQLNYMVSNNFAFGGQNACLVFGRES
jgi:3-oxoacyl-[acyl-carrier-protein] synthase II